MTSLPATTNQSASHKGIANQIDTATRSRNAQVIKNMSGAGPLRNRSFGTGERCRLPASAAVCLIPCLILWFAYVESVCKCRAPNSPGGLNGRIASVIASLFSSSRPPPPARASYLEHLILPTATATTPPPASIPTTARSGEHPPHKPHVVGLAVLIRLAAADGDQHAVAVAGADGDPPQGANLTRLGTLRQSEEIIVPVSIRVGSQVLPATIAGIHDTHIGPVSRRINDEEGVRPVFDAGNYVLGGPLPTASANMGPARR